MKENISFKKTKIIATVGPASNSKSKLIELVMAGADIFRLNFSHGSHEDHLKVINYVREINEELGTHICLLQDLQGPKIRLRDVEGGGVEVLNGDELTISTEKIVGNNKLVSTTYQAIVD